MEYLLGMKRYLIILIASALQLRFYQQFFIFCTGNGASSIMGGISGAIFGFDGSFISIGLEI